MKLLAALVLAAAVSASAQTLPSVQLNWNAVTTNTDGTALTAPVTYNAYETPCGQTSGGTLIGSGLATANWTYSNAALTGTECFNVTAVVAGVEGAYSNQASKSFSAPTPVLKTPSAPAGLTAQ